MSAAPQLQAPAAVVLLELSLQNFRNHRSSNIGFASGLTVVSGANGEGKTNLLEAIGYLSSLGSFRGASTDTMIGIDDDTAYVRARLDVGGREQLIEAQLDRRGRNRVQVNRQPLRRARDLLGTLRVVVFAPDDLAIVKGGPGERRSMLDEVLSTVHPRHESDRSDLDRILRQRASVLKQAAGRRAPEIDATLDVWDAKLHDVGTRHAAARAALVDELQPLVADLYAALAGRAIPVELNYRRSWEGELVDALAASRDDDVRRRISLVGPHRDDLEVRLDGLPARTHASQGEQRSLALALRLGSQRVIAARVGREPIVLLDDVFSELDVDRARALVRELPSVQTILTTATGSVPDGAVPARSYVVADGQVAEVDANRHDDGVDTEPVIDLDAAAQVGDTSARLDDATAEVDDV